MSELIIFLYWLYLSIENILIFYLNTSSTLITRAATISRLKELVAAILIID